MSPNWFGTLCAVLAIAAFFPSYRWGSKATSKQKLLFAVVALLGSIPGASFAAYYAHVLPEPSWYYEFRSWRGTECWLVVLGVAGGLVASLLPRMLRLLLLTLVAAFAITPILKPFAAPLSQERWSGTDSPGSPCPLRGHKRRARGRQRRKGADLDQHGLSVE